MVKIKEILTLDLNEDIKNVIDLEDQSEKEIQSELESYIVTEGIARHLYNFTNQFTSNIKETGVWLSGFYGSGKSYFGKMIGYILNNHVINGTLARDRFIPRLKGVSDESLIENSIRNLDSIKSRVVLLDVAKQNTDKGLAFTLFFNFLKCLGFRDDIYGYMEFDLFIDGKFDEFKDKALELEGEEWDVLKKSNRRVAKVMRSIFTSMGYSEADYQDTYKVYSDAINNFSSSKFKDELEKYIKFVSDETIVFIFDEASEAIAQQKFTLLDLEAISESLSSISHKVWTIAIAQEKLDDVINNNNVSRSQLIKVTDRFKTKIHLESTEVDVIIRSRLLQKKDKYYKQLIDYYKKNEGLISDATNLKSAFPTKTKSAEEFATYYPFHKYQFDILQKFLFSSNALVATQIAARGMIITTFDVLRKQMKDKELFSFASGSAICTEAQTAPPSGLVNKYDTSLKIIKEKDLSIDGKKLLKTIHLLSDSEVVSATVENVTKSYITDISTYYDIKPVIEEALNLLVEEKVLLLSNNNYKITSDLEEKLLDEMRSFSIELFNKKRSLINYIKSYKLFHPVSGFNDGSDLFKFSILSDQEDELCSSGSKQLKLIAFSLFNINENRQDFIESLKMETQHDKDQISLVPDNKEFSIIDKLIGEISRYIYMEEKYSNESDSVKRQIIRDFSLIREEKEKDLRIRIETAYRKSSLIYMFDETLLTGDSFKNAINEIQRKLVKNIFTKRLSTQLSESIVIKVFAKPKEDLRQLFSGDDFKFFDANGNFVGDHLKVVEEITGKINSKFYDGKSLESELSVAPWGYSFGTIVVTLAVLFRAGKLSVKYNGDTWFSHKEKSVQEAFINTTRFKSASFKSVTTNLSSAQKSQAVQILLDLEIKENTDYKIDWNSTDFDIAGAIKHMADHYLGAINYLNNDVENFELFFKNVADKKIVLQEYSGKVNENNYIEKVETFLDSVDDYKSAIQTIIKAQKFKKKKFSIVRNFKRFIEEVVAELKKSDCKDQDIIDVYDEFMSLFEQDMIKNYIQIQQKTQTVKDIYFKLIKNASEIMSQNYLTLQGKVEDAIHDLKKNYPSDINSSNLYKLEKLRQYCKNRIVMEPKLEYSVTCKECGYSLSDILNYTALVSNKENDLFFVKTSFISEMPEEIEEENETGNAGLPDNTEISPKPVIVKIPRKITLKLPGKIMTVQDYKSVLTKQLTSLAAAKPDEEIELKIETI